MTTMNLTAKQEKLVKKVLIQVYNELEKYGSFGKLTQAEEEMLIELVNEIND